MLVVAAASVERGRCEGALRGNVGGGAISSGAALVTSSCAVVVVVLSWQPLACRPAPLRPQSPTPLLLLLLEEGEADVAVAVRIEDIAVDTRGEHIIIMVGAAANGLVQLMSPLHAAPDAIGS